MKKKSVLVMTAVLITMMLAGCGSKPAPAPTTAAPAETQAAKETAAPAAETTAAQEAKGSGEAADYPKEPIRIIVPFAAGGGGDTLVRTIEPFWAEALGGASFSIENMGGSGTQIGMTEIFNAGDDPYVVGVISQPHTSLTIDVQDAPYKLEDFQCINLHNVDPQSVFIVKSFAEKNNVHTFQELLDYMKAHPGTSIGVNGSTGGHLFAAYMNTTLDLGASIVPYNSGSEARTALMGGIIDAMVMNEAASLSLEDGICLASNWTSSELWDAPLMSEVYPELAEVGLACANYKFMGCSMKLKEEHPEIFEKLVETYKEAYLNEEHLKICEGQGLLQWMEWFGPEKSQEMWYSAQEVSNKYSGVFK